MAARSNREVLDKFYECVRKQSYENLEEIAQPDLVQEWPQSGERFRGLANVRAVLENYPEFPKQEVRRVVGAPDRWVTTPSFTPLRISGTGDNYTIEANVTYPNGDVWSSIHIVEFRDGKMSRMTDYFAAPFPAAEWRAKWAEKMEDQPG